MQGLTTALLSRACRIFFALAYPQGENTVPPARAAYLHLDDRRPLEAVLAPPVCQQLAGDGRVRGYALRLGSVHYPHLKMQVVNCDHAGTWVFAVDTHDGLRLEPGHADAERWSHLQAGNRRLKEQIERAWEAAGLLTFNALLRRGLACGREGREQRSGVRGQESGVRGQPQS
jgi:hypothetical protein